MMQRQGDDDRYTVGKSYSLSQQLGVLSFLFNSASHLKFPLLRTDVEMAGFLLSMFW
jgi:hypothetical protein